MFSINRWLAATGTAMSGSMRNIMPKKAAGVCMEAIALLLIDLVGTRISPVLSSFDVEQLRTAGRNAFHYEGRAALVSEAFRSNCEDFA